MTVSDSDSLDRHASAPRAAAFHAHVGSKLQILIRRAQLTNRFASSVVGYVSGEYVILKTPTEGGFGVPMQNGERMHVRMFTGTHVAEFETVLLRQLRAPIYQWHVQYPELVQLVGLRTAPRVRVDLNGRAKAPGGSAVVEIRFVDLSAEGGQFIGPPSLGEKDTELALTFSIGLRNDGPPIEISVNAKIKVVKVLTSESEAAARCSYGLQFEPPTELDQLRIQNFVLQRLHDGPNELV